MSILWRWHTIKNSAIPGSCMMIEKKWEALKHKQYPTIRTFPFNVLTFNQLLVKKLKLLTQDNLYNNECNGCWTPLPEKRNRKGNRFTVRIKNRSSKYCPEPTRNLNNYFCYFFGHLWLNSLYKGAKILPFL